MVSIFSCNLIRGLLFFVVREYNIEAKSKCKAANIVLISANQITDIL